VEYSKDISKFCEVAKELGAADAKIINTSCIVVENRIRLKCQYGCPFYGHYLTCPPFSPSPEQTTKIINEYNWALLFTVHFSSVTSKGVFEEGIHSIKDMTILQKIAAELEKKIFLSGYPLAFAMTGGPCLLCSECILQPGKCRHPETARPAMESMGINVAATIEKTGYKFKVYTSTSEIVTSYGLVLIT
jgi:predicted metal-binding protein